MNVDLIVIGGGPAGYEGALRAAGEGMSVLLVEKEHIGGVCLNEGCIPTKSLLYSAKVYEHAKNGAVWGVQAADIRLDHGAAVARKEKVVKTLVDGVRAQLRAAKVQVVEGTAVIRGRTSDGLAVAVGGEGHTGKRLLLATGSTSVLPPISGLSEAIASGFAMTNREILALPTLPETLCVIGGGVIGLEMACYFAMAGAKVVVVEMLETIAGAVDSGISALLKKNLEKLGVMFYLGAQVTAVGEDSVTFMQKGQPFKIACERVLVSIGRKAVLPEGIQTLGVLVEKGAVVTDEKCRTNVGGVYAAGDVNGKSMLAHTAYREADVAVAHMVGRDARMRYDAIASVIYTQPEVASIGETEATAKQKGMQVLCQTMPMAYSGRYVAETDGGNGVVKLVVEAGTKRVVGVHMITPYASECIWGVAPLLEGEWRVADVRELVFPHPTICEIIREAALHMQA